MMPTTSLIRRSVVKRLSPSTISSISSSMSNIYHTNDTQNKNTISPSVLLNSRRHKSIQPSYNNSEEEEKVNEIVNFPSSSSSTSLNKANDTTPVLLNSKEHAVGYLNKILNAKVYEASIETQLQHAKSLSMHLQNTVLLKREDTQPVFSFKIRGAYNKMAHLTPEELSNGVVACSAGNHAQGVALSAKMLQCHAVIVMPLATPSIKVNAVRQHGGPTVEVRLFGNNYDEAAAEAKRLQKEENMTMIHPFDDPYVIAGQGTIGVEILKECVNRPLDTIFVCCGGGGMLAGIAAYVKRVRPNIKIIGVEAEDAAGMTASLREGSVQTLDGVGLFADGAAVRTVGSETFRVCNELVDGMITVTTDQICNAIKLTYNDARVVLEPAGALAVAGLKKYVEEGKITGKTMVAITSGANMDFDRLRFVSERADESERTLAVTIPETAGSFRQLYSAIWPRNVTQFSYRYESDEEANIFISFQPVMNIENDFENIMDKLHENGFTCSDISHDELAKLHVRHLAGGRSVVPKERLFRFEFPESPGALQRFLTSLDMSWNVSLFHYRNHGDDFGRVLVGIQVGKTCARLEDFLSKLGYSYTEETNNPVYHQFLRNGINNDDCTTLK
jgi:threonine dehydratase